ncbi:uncharacterized protein J7T54_004156, partial [Emericellopsis cladophorae]
MSFKGGKSSLEASVPSSSSTSMRSIVNGARAVPGNGLLGVGVAAGDEGSIVDEGAGDEGSVVEAARETGGCVLFLRLLG